MTISVTGCFDLQSGIHLHEEEFASVIVKDELDSSGAFVFDGEGSGSGFVPDVFPNGIIQVRGGRFLKDFLMSSLNRTVTLTQGDTIAVLVGRRLEPRYAWVL